MLYLQDLESLTRIIITISYSITYYEDTMKLYYDIIILLRYNITNITNIIINLQYYYITGRQHIVNLKIL